MEVTNSDIKARFGEFKKIYEDKRKFKSFSAVVSGLPGSGKTSFIATGRKPILIDSFDSKNTIILERTHAEEIRKGEIIIRTFWGDNSKYPNVLKQWEQIHNEDIKRGDLNLFGTYAIDSLTSFMEALANQVSVLQKRNRKVQKLAISDYVILYDYILDVIRETSEQNCDFILTTHLEQIQDEVTGRLMTEIKTYKGLQTLIPIQFTEKYIIEKIETAQGIKHQLLTNAAGRFRASTQLGAGGKLNDTEIPDIKHILRKIGMSDKDKPAIL